ncbi:MAG: hypothetical protein GY856_34745 [bacterium]|nr:hypothetical protein [bacterium]
MTAPAETASPLAQRSCAHHPDRPALARCMSCERSLCQGCAQRWEGIFYCTSCLGERRAAARRGGSAFGWLVLGAAIFALFAATWGLRVLLAAVLGGWF